MIIDDYQPTTNQRYNYLALETYIMSRPVPFLPKRTALQQPNSLDDGVADFLGDAVSVDRDTLSQVDYPNTTLQSYVASAYNYVSHNVPYVASM